MKFKLDLRNIQPIKHISCFSHLNKTISHFPIFLKVFPGGTSGKETTCQWDIRNLNLTPGGEKHLEEVIATNSNILAGEYLGQKRLAGYSP